MEQALTASDFAEYLSDDEISKMAPLIDRLKTLEEQKTSQDNYLKFVKKIWPSFIEGKHHKIYADKLQKVADGKIKRLIVNMPPRHTKSEFASYLFPAWLMGRRPDLKIIQATHTAELAVGFGRKVKNLIDSDDFRDIFPEIKLATDAKASGRWSTNGGGEYYAVGVGGALAGRGADLCIIDDPVSEQDALSPTALDSIYEWYTSGPRQRLQPGGSIIIVMTRWGIKDLTARVIAKQSEGGADRWEVVEFPAIFPDTNNVLWPEYWSRDELDGVKASIPVAKWNAQYMQNPTAEEGAIIKREWWNVWDIDKPPPCSYIIQSYDTAFSKSDRADFSAITTWGIFTPVEGEGDAIILLDAEKGRWDFPELKLKAQELNEAYEPDMILIEQKASGTPLTQELRRMGIPVTPFTPSKGADKFARMNACAPVFESGMVWRPDANFAEEVVEECASFPHGDHDDLADSMTQAILRFRQGGFISTPDDEEFEPGYRRKMEYY
jgi:predicted phage terminase large subunit-like protein